MKKFLILLLVVYLVVFMLSLSVFAEGDAIIADGYDDEVQAVVDGWWQMIRQYLPDDWGDYIDNNIMPWVSLSFSAVVAIYLLICPILEKIKASSTVFDGASEKLEEAKEIAAKSKERFDSTRADVERLRKEFETVKNGYGDVKFALGNIERILRVAFENSDELIIKGVAREIERIGAVDEKAEK